ncbi:MAG: hypothetical protein IJY86_02800 [Clostridia bacterium]|nr:hypothetical protein [Clostridia bacterium]
MPDSQAKKDWVKKHTTTITCTFNHNTDGDILKQLETVPNRTGYIKELIRRDIAQSETK